MRILLVSDHFPPYIGGAHLQIEHLGLELNRRGHEVNIATVWQPGVREHDEATGIKVYRLKQMRTLLLTDRARQYQHHQPPFPDPVTVYGLRRLIQKLKPDVIHSHGWISFSCAAAMSRTNIPLVISGRDYGYSCATRSMLYHDQLCTGPKFIKCVECASKFYGLPKGIGAVIGIRLSQPKLRRKLNGVHSVSVFVQEIINRDFIGKHRSEMESRNEAIIERVISSFLIDQNQHPADIDFNQRLPVDPFILFVGGLQPRKGLETLLDAYRHLTAPPPLVLIGYTSLNMPESYPPGVQVLVDVPHPLVMSAWEHALFGVMPSSWPDPSPGVVREAFSKSRAVIGTNIGGTPEMIDDGVTGLLVPPEDENALTSAMQLLISDQVLREKMGKAALAKAGTYTAEMIIPQFEKLYQQVIENGSHSRVVAADIK